MKNKKRNKPTQFIDESGREFLRDGRHPCLCEASKHNLINNCLYCGRIVCEQEGIGPCFTCGSYVLSKQERERLMSGTEQASADLHQLIKNGAQLDFVDSKKNLSLKEIAASLSSNQNPNLNKAIEHKDKLLEFDQKSVARSKVFDDQVDYFTMRSQNFITDQNRQAIGEKIDYLVENKFKTTDKIVLDLDNLTVSDYAEPVIKDLNEEHRKLEELSTIQTDYEFKPASYFIDSASEATKKNLPPPIYVPSVENDSEVKNKKKDNKHDKNKNNKKDKTETTNKGDNPERKPKLPKALTMENFKLRIQDREMAKIEDNGMCLAVQQPFASLLVAGIKKFEGRTWYHPFKGRLWIYAAQKRPTVEEIQEIEQFYRRLGHTNFPNGYPTGAIVGCVIVEDCLANGACMEQYPHCECDSPYVFVCDYPIALERPLPLPKGGGRQIYKLDPQVHKACKGLLGF